MTKKGMSEKIKEGVSVQEIENFARKHLTEVLLILAIIIATISSMFNFFTSASWSILFAGIGAIISIALPEKIEAFQRAIFKFAFKQEKTTQIIIGSVRIILAIFLPLVLFAELGLLAGTAFHYLIKTSPEAHKGEEKAPEHSSEEEEHL